MDVVAYLCHKLSESMLVKRVSGYNIKLFGYGIRSARYRCGQCIPWDVWGNVKCSDKVFSSSYLNPLSRKKRSKWPIRCTEEAENQIRCAYAWIRRVATEKYSTLQRHRKYFVVLETLSTSVKYMLYDLYSYFFWYRKLKSQLLTLSFKYRNIWRIIHVLDMHN